VTARRKSTTRAHDKTARKSATRKTEKPMMRAARDRRIPKAGKHKPARGVRVGARYGTGFDDKLHPTSPIDLETIGSVSDLVGAYGNAAIGARQVSHAADILQAMAEDDECFVVLTVSGAMTVAKMGLILCDMIDAGMVQAVVSTGALMAHGFVESAGKVHFKYDPSMKDEELFERGYNRVYDSLELEQNLDDVERIIQRVLAQGTPGELWSSERFNRLLGEYLDHEDSGRGILRSAWRNGVPVYVPAFTDSELGLDFAIFNHRREQAGLPREVFDPFLDLEDYTRRADKAKRLGIFTIGGGVPRNWAQQVGPYLDILQKRAGVGKGLSRFHYGVRICPEPVHWGGLSGCTYSEGVSWGKFVPQAEGGRYAEVYADATIVWPLVVKAVLERMPAAAKRARQARRVVAGKRRRAAGGAKRR
jgi:deoxyhypusine synthase